MNKAQHVIVTTSNSIEGSKIVSYGGIITSHVVAGTNIFSDIFAGFSDFFGGRSKSYQNQIESVKEEAIFNLKQKARSCNCNGIISVNIDVDEISGKNVSMFMITVYGTAVSLQFENADVLESSKSVIDGSEIEKSLKRNFLTEKFADNPLLVNKSDDAWNEILTLSLPGLAPKIVDFFRKKQNSLHLSQAVERLVEYTHSLCLEDAKKLLYDLASDHKSANDGYIEYAKVIIKCGLLDYEETHKLLKNELPRIRRAALYILTTFKDTYAEPDLVWIKHNIELIENSFPETCEIYTKQSFVGAEKELWKCEYGHDGNTLEYSNCKACSCDRYGFLPDETKPQEVIEHLECILINLKRALLK